MAGPPSPEKPNKPLPAMVMHGAGGSGRLGRQGPGQIGDEERTRDTTTDAERITFHE